ncbi:MAG: hypothetical protein ACAI38_17145 [Myxococcota bacterium]|nr:hypothetical protein [Myxococcota bacterium]
MQKAIVVSLALLAACGELQVPGGPSQNNTNANNGTPTCSGLEGETFSTAEDQLIDQRCQFDADNNYQCTDLYGGWDIFFDDGDFYWTTFQNTVVGSYTCRNGTITGEADGIDYDGSFTGNALTWEGLQYRR